jgi:hypothetical protein
VAGRQDDSIFAGRSQHGGIWVRSIVVNAAALLFVAAGHGFSQAAPPSPDVSHYMVIIATSTASATNGVQMTVLTFPSERACAAAAAVFGQPVDGAKVVARCAPQK